MPEFDRENSQLSKYQEFSYFKFQLFQILGILFLAKAVELQCEAVKEMPKEAVREKTNSTPMLNFVIADLFYS